MFIVFWEGGADLALISWEKERGTHDMSGLVTDGAVRGAFHGFLQFDYILSSWPFGSADNVKFYTLPFFEGFKTLALNSGMMDKYIFAAILLNKTKSFGIVKPFNRSFCHCRSSLCQTTNMRPL